ncbi:uncharacterized protein LOC119383567 [Rhipicephalus sanguineus]|uniref:uncharacterized protein LOC119383567 n=1 Tax=Rhipicephalus sanguineus TaxID=34632 RepID=UPI0018932B52|nr:uncharacterized protein LOC119383567 [Rhipicephalus sanguineus]
MPSAGRVHTKTAKTTKSSFRSELRNLLATAVRLNVPPSAVDECLRELFLKRPSTTCASTSATSVSARVTNILVWCTVLVLSLRLVLLIGFDDMTIYQLYDRLTYPALRTARLLALPLLNQFPSLAQYHGRKCLVQNPFFNPMNESECWPCENFKSIVDLTGHSDTAEDYVWSLMPFVVKDALKVNVSGEHVHQFLKAHLELTSDTSAEFYSTLRGIREPRHLLELQEWQKVDDQYFHISWALASPPAARILRKVFNRPYFVQNVSEVSLQRFLLFDGPDAPSYYLPETDFSSSWLVQVEGSRLVVLEPSELCIRSCRQVSVLLKPNDVLHFSSTISKARSVPAHIGDEPSITYLGSFY